MYVSTTATVVFLRSPPFFVLLSSGVAAKKMASSALEEKINKIRLQNEEIKRRYEEVEADKKNAAKLNALVQMVPSDDWPERKEPPEFSAPPKNIQKQKFSNKDYNERPQHYTGVQERLTKKDHKFAQGDGPPPDPKYNFLADSEREMYITSDGKVDEDKNKSRNKGQRGALKRRSGGGGSRDTYYKDNRGSHTFYGKEETLPEYEAWRAERNRIDEARINRQKTAEGNWRREWDSNKTNIEKDPLRKGDSNRKDSNNYERRNNYYNNDHSNRGHGGSRTYHGSQKTHQDYRRSHYDQSYEHKRQADNKSIDDRTVTATDKSIKVTLNHGNQMKAPVMSVKVNSPSIAGTGRVGPRQKSGITYSSHSDVDVTTHEINNFSRQKSFDEKTAGAKFNNGQKIAPKSPFSQRKKENNSKSPYPQRKEFRNNESSARSKNPSKNYSQKSESRDLKQSSGSKSQRTQKRAQKPVIDKLENASISDNVTTLDDNSNKSFDREESHEEQVNDKIDHDENVSNITINANEELTDTSKDLDDSGITVNITDQSICDDNIEIAIHKNENNECNQDEENKQSIENAKNIETAKSNENDIESENNIEISSENIEKNKTETIISDNILEEKENKHEIPSSKSELTMVENLEKENNITVHETVKEETMNEEIKMSISDKENELEIINSQKNETDKTKKDDELNKIEESKKNVEDLKIDSEITCTEDKIMNESTEEENKISENVSNIEVINDSGFIEDSDKLQNNSSDLNIESTAEDNNKENSEESTKSELDNLTKEICENTKICDIHNAASNETSQAVYNNTGENEDKQKIINLSDISTKDSDIKNADKTDNDQELSNIDKQNVTKIESTEKENSTIEETTTIAAEE